MKVAIVGGGVIGLCAAEALARRDAEVVLVEAGVCGSGASAGNAGWITPGLSAPLPAPGTMARALRWMASPDSPLYIRPVPRWSLLRWSYEFWRSTGPRRYRAGMAALVTLSSETIRAYDALAERGVRFEMHADGLLFVALSQGALAAELSELRDQRALGYSGEVSQLQPEEALALEPGLRDQIAGGILARDERHVRPESLTQGLVEHLRETGVEVREHTPVERLISTAGRWRLVCSRAQQDPLDVDAVVVAAGAACGNLLGPLGIQLPLQGAKGYSITDEHPLVQLTRPVYMLEAKVGASPFEGGLRLAGTLELGARDLRLDARRLRSLDRAGEAYLRAWNPRRACDRWAGFRPMFPDGLPALGPIPEQAGLFVATGHGMLGVTLAPATAEALAPAVLEGRSSLDLRPFSVARFSRRGSRRSRPPGSSHNLAEHA